MFAKSIVYYEYQYESLFYHIHIFTWKNEKKNHNKYNKIILKLKIA